MHPFSSLREGIAERPRSSALYISPLGLGGPQTGPPAKPPPWSYFLVVCPFSKASSMLLSSRMLKKPASGVLALLRGSTYRTEYASPLRVLRPCWTNFLSIPPGILPLRQARGPVNVHRATIAFPQPASAATVRPREIITLVNCPFTRHTDDADFSSRQPRFFALLEGATE